MPSELRIPIEKEGQAIRHMRTMAGLQQQELAAQIGLSKNYMTKVETGVYRIARGKFLQIAEVCRCSVEICITFKEAGQ